MGQAGDWRDWQQENWYPQGGQRQGGGPPVPPGWDERRPAPRQGAPRQGPQATPRPQPYPQQGQWPPSPQDYGQPWQPQCYRAPVPQAPPSPPARHQAPKPKAAAGPKAKANPKVVGCLGCLGVVAVIFGLVTWFVLATQNDGTTSPAISQAPIPSEAVIAPGTFPVLAPLVLGHFPDTADGDLARETCTQWAGLRQEYVYRLSIGTPYQMNGWFSSSAWAKALNDGNELGDDPDYGKIETGLGVVTYGDAASDANAALMDKACEDAD